MVEPAVVRLSVSGEENVHFEYALPSGAKDVVVAYGAADNSSQCELTLGDGRRLQFKGFARLVGLRLEFGAHLNWRLVIGLKAGSVRESQGICR